MNEHTTDRSSGADGIAPLPGEAGIPSVAERPRQAKATMQRLAMGLLVLSLLVSAAIGLQRYLAQGEPAPEAESRLVADRPSAATTQPRRLEIPTPPSGNPAQSTDTRIPAIEPTPEEAEPIGVRRTGPGAPTGGGPRTTPAEDAPVLLVSVRPGAAGTAAAGLSRPARQPEPGSREEAQAFDPDDPVAMATHNLQSYQHQLQGLLDNLSAYMAPATGPRGGDPPTGALLGTAPTGVPPGVGPLIGGPLPSSGGLFGGQLQGSATPRTAATTLGYRSLTLPKGTAFTCALKTRVVSATSGLVGCQVQRNVFGDDGRVLLIERGSHLYGEYRIASVRPGTVRIPVLWTRIRTPLGVTVDVDSPGTGQLGESGIDGHVDNRWSERLGAAMLLSLIDDSVKLLIQNQASEGSGETIVLPSTTDNTSKLAEKVLDSTINIPPLIYQNQGGIVGIYVARDVDFSSVYELQSTPTTGEAR